MSNQEDAPSAACVAQQDAAGSVQRRRVLHRDHAARLGHRPASAGESTQAGARSVALLPRVPRQLPHDRRRVARPHRTDGSARSGRRDPVAAQPARPARRGLPAVPDAPRRRSAPRRQRRAGVRHDVRAHTARDSHLRVRPRRIRTSRTSLQLQRRARNQSNPGEAIWLSWLVYVVAILIGLAVPTVAVAFYFGIAIYLVVPFREIRRLLFKRA